MIKIGIFGGSFDPVHNEHVKIALGAIDELGLEKLIIIPTFVAPHKIGADVSSGEDRINMLKLAFKGHDKVEISDFEIKSGGVSFSYLTITHFKKVYPNAELYFFVGSDMLENFPTWKNPQIVLDNATLCLIERKSEGISTQKAVNEIKRLYKKDVLILKTYGTFISSTLVRTLLKLNLNTDGLINSDVKDYIIKNNIYKKDEYYSHIAKTLPEKRRLHTAGVIATAKSLAKKLGANQKKVELAALLHDIAKYEKSENYPNFKRPNGVYEEIVHQFLGEYIAKEVLKVKDEEVLSAIKYHSTGRPNMSLIEKIIYVADLIEPSRKYQGVEELREQIKKDFDVGFIVCISEVLEFLKKDNSPIYYLTLDTYDYYKEKI